MDEVCLNDMLGDVLHEGDISFVPNMQNSGNADDIFAMHFDSDVGSVISLIVARFVASSVGVCINLLLRDVAFHLSDPDGLGPLGFSSLLKVVPKVPIRCGTPVDLVCFAPLEVTQDPNRNYQCLYAQAHWQQAQ